jgi:hypothetical protein
VDTQLLTVLTPWLELYFQCLLSKSKRLLELDMPECFNMSYNSSLAGHTLSD